MKRPSAPSLNLQKQIIKLFSIVREEGHTSSYSIVPAFLILGRLSTILGVDAYSSQAFYTSALSNNSYQRERNAADSALAWLGDYMLRLSPSTRQRLVHEVELFNLPTLTQVEFEDVIDFAFDQLPRYNHGSGEFSTPAELTELIASIYKAKPGMCVYNPQAGTAALISFLDPAVIYLGQEQSDEVRKLASLRLVAHQRSSAHLLPGTAVEQWPQLPAADLILATHPVFGGSNRVNQLLDGLPSSMPVDAAFVHAILRHMQPQSQAVIPVALGFLFQQGKSYRLLREELVTSGVLEAVVDFPAGLLLPYTNVRLALLMLNKARSYGAPVLMLDAESYVHRKGKQAILDTSALLTALAQPTGATGAHFIAPSDFSRHDYDLSYRRYLLPAEPVQNQVRFEEIVEPIRLRHERPVEGRLLRIRDMKSDNLNFTLASSELPVDQFSGRSLVSLKQDALLVALQGGRPKPTWYTHQAGDEVFFSPSSILPLQLNQDKVVLDYLIAELNSDFVQEQFRSMNRGMAMPTVRKADLLQLIINLPSIVEQHNLVRLASEQATKTKQVESNAAQTERTLKAEAYAQLAALKHALGRPQLNLISNVDLLEAAIQRAASHNQVLAPHSPLFPGEDSTVQDTLTAIKRDLEFMFQTLNRNEAVLVLEEFPRQVVDILAFLREEIALTRASLPPFAITLHEKFLPLYNFLGDKPRVAQRIDSVAVLANKYLLKLLFNHIIDNAQRHGFHEMPAEHNKISVTVEELFVDENMNSFALDITIANNGRPFPVNFDIAQLTRKGATVGATGNTGIGGYEVKEIMNYFEGELEIISQPESDFPVTYRLELPVVDVQYKKG